MPGQDWIPAHLPFQCVLRECITARCRWDWQFRRTMSSVDVHVMCRLCACGIVCVCVHAFTLEWSPLIYAAVFWLKREPAFWYSSICLQVIVQRRFCTPSLQDVHGPRLFVKSWNDLKLNLDTSQQGANLLGWSARRAPMRVKIEKLDRDQWQVDRFGSLWNGLRLAPMTLWQFCS